MFSFFKKQKYLPAFPELESYVHKDKYFMRIASWGWLNDKMIFVTDPHGPRMLTFDPWLQLIFLEAGGDKTVSEFVYDMAGKYSGPVPANLVQTVIEELDKLLGYRVVQLTDSPQKPSPEHFAPNKV